MSALVAVDRRVDLSAILLPFVPSLATAKSRMHETAWVVWTGVESVGVGLLHSKPGTGRELQKRGEKIRKDSLFREYGEEVEEKKRKPGRGIGSEVNSLVFRVSSDQRLLSSIC